MKIRLHRQVRAELRQLGELECGNCYSKLILITPGNQRGESEHATGVVGEPVHAGVADAELTE